MKSGQISAKFGVGVVELKPSQSCLFFYKSSFYQQLRQLGEYFFSFRQYNHTQDDRQKGNEKDKL